MAEAFDDYYAGEQWYYGTPASEELEAFLKSHPNMAGNALDLGCGEGRDSILLAKQGFRVTAVDRSVEGIRKLAAFARENNLPISAHVGDVANYSIELHEYDVICLVTILDHLNSQDIELVSKRVCAGLRPGGIVFAEVFTTKDPGCTGDEGASETAEYVSNYFKPGSLRAFFSSLSIELYEEKDEIDESHGPAHRHNVAILIGRRVG